VYDLVIWCLVVWFNSIARDEQSQPKQPCQACNKFDALIYMARMQLLTAIYLLWPSHLNTHMNPVHWSMVSQILWAALDCLLGHVLILVAFDAGDSRSTAERQMAIAIQASIDRPPVDLDPTHTAG